MWPFKRNKYKKLKRQEVIDAIVELDNREASLEALLVSKAKEEEELLEKGKAEKNHDIRLLWAKKIESIRKERKTLVQRSLYLLYNLQLLNKLRDALDDKEFIKAAGDISLHELLADQKNLAKFLNQALNTRVKSEEIMTEADEIFNQVVESYEPDQKIYGVGETEDELLAMFEDSEELPISKNLSKENKNVNY